MVSTAPVAPSVNVISVMSTNGNIIEETRPQEQKLRDGGCRFYVADLSAVARACVVFCQGPVTFCGPFPF